MSACKPESELAAVIATGNLPEDLRLHLDECAACREVYSVAVSVQRLAAGLAGEAAPSAASMWFRVNCRLRQERALRAQLPLIWMSRILYAALVPAAAILLFRLANLSSPAVVIGLASFGVMALPVSIVLWGWSRSNR
jgi:hypothetical protein